MTNYIITEGQKMGKCPEVSEHVSLTLHNSLFLVLLFLLTQNILA